MFENFVVPRNILGSIKSKGKEVTGDTNPKIYKDSTSYAIEFELTDELVLKKLHLQRFHNKDKNYDQATLKCFEEFSKYLDSLFKEIDGFTGQQLSNVYKIKDNLYVEISCDLSMYCESYILIEIYDKTRLYELGFDDLNNDDEEKIKKDRITWLLQYIDKSELVNAIKDCIDESAKINTDNVEQYLLNLPLDEFEEDMNDLVEFFRIL